MYVPERTSAARADVLCNRTVVLIGDDPLATERIGRCLADFDLVVLATASDGRSGELLVARQSPDIVLLDLGIPEALETARRIVQSGHTCVILVCDHHPAAGQVPDGVAGIVLKPVDGLTLVPDIRSFYRRSCLGAPRAPHREQDQETGRGRRFGFSFADLCDAASILDGVQPATPDAAIEHTATSRSRAAADAHVRDTDGISTNAQAVRLLPPAPIAWAAYLAYRATGQSPRDALCRARTEWRELWEIARPSGPCRFGG
jgi:DNA-binding NarL/FixJ family response regulator